MKEAFYFPHDYNAKEDEKIIKLRAKRGWEGYGIYWAIIEMLANSSEARLSVVDIEDYAFVLRTDCESIKSVIFDYNLFEFDEKFFWSKRLLKFFSLREEKSFLARQSAKTRWNKQKQEYANAMRTQCDSNAIKERKGKERKEKKIEKKVFGEFQNVHLSEDEEVKLIALWGTRGFTERVEKLSAYCASKGVIYRSHYATLLNWERKNTPPTVATPPDVKFI